MEMREQSLEQQDQTLNAEQTNVQNVSEETVEVAESQVEQSHDEAQPATTKEALLETLAVIAEKPAVEIGRDEVARVKQQFYAIRKIELEKDSLEIVKGGNSKEVIVNILPLEAANRKITAVPEDETLLKCSAEDGRRIGLCRKEIPKYL